MIKRAFCWLDKLDLAIDYLGRLHLTEDEVRSLEMIGEEIEWMRAWEDWERRRKVENLLRSMGNDHR